MNKLGLGKGLEAILGTTEQTQVVQDNHPSKDGVISISVSKLQAGKYQPRENFDEENLSDLIASITEKGVIQPLLVRPLSNQEDRYEIIAGERRFRASIAAGLTEVPVIVKNFNDLEALEVSLIENLQRADLNPIEEAKGYQRLMKEFQKTQEELSKTLGKSRSHVANMVRLLTLPDVVKEALEKNIITSGHARALVGLENAEFLLKQIITNGLSVREVEKIVQNPNMTEMPISKPKKKKDNDIIALEEELTSILKTGVKINWNGKKGKISIECHSLEKLDLILSRLTAGGVVPEE